MKASDYIAEFLVEQGIKYVFGTTGGAIIHTFDSIGKRKDIEYICPQHEQAAAMAADGYSRITKNMGVAIATSGPGATNLLTGTCSSYYDSIPILNITGQVPTKKFRKNKLIRQVGFQETPITEIFHPITKYSVLVKDKEKLRYELEKAVYIAKTGRPGPVLVDIPDDIQRGEINPETIQKFIPKPQKKNYKSLEEKVEECLRLMREAERPIIVLGAGVKLGDSEKEAIEFIRKSNFPANLTWATIDMMEYDDKLNAGGFGVTSQRYGNFAIQNSDLVIGLGTRIDFHHTGTPKNMFAREAKKIFLDIDEYELKKHYKDLGLDLAINADVKDFFEIINKKLGGVNKKDISPWLNKIKEWKNKYPPYQKEDFKEKNFVNPYVFLEELSKKSKEGDVIIPDTGNNLAQTMGGYRIRKKQTIFSSFNNCPMGYSLPASIGACFAKDKKSINCITGDGGLQMNIQELATINYHKLPIKLFIFNNQGYGMIKQTQDDWLNSKYEASCKEKGVATPNFLEVGKAYGIKSESIRNHEDLIKKLPSILESPEAILCNLNLNPCQKTIPVLQVGNPIEDSKPLLPRKEFLENMIIKPLK